MNRTIKGATVKRYHYDSHDQLRQHLGNCVAAYNFARRLKTLKGFAPYEAICKAWQKEPGQFTSNPHHKMPEPNNRRSSVRRVTQGATMPVRRSPAAKVVVFQ